MKEKRSSLSHSESDSSTESSSEDEPTENKCYWIEDDECLSIHTSKNEMEEDYKPEVAFFTRYSLLVSFYSLLVALLLITCCSFTCYSLLSYSLLVVFLLVTRCIFTHYSLLIVFYSLLIPFYSLP